MEFAYKIRIAFWLISGAVIASLLFLGIVPGGKITYSGIPGSGFFIKKLAPAERLDKGVIAGDPVYFSVRTPRRFDRARIVLAYEKKGDFPIIELGALADNRGNYSLRPVENKILDDLDWNRIVEGDLTLYQRNKKFDSIGEFLAAPPPSDEIAVYNHDFNREHVIADYAPDKEKRVFDYQLRGPYQFFTYIKEEELSFKFTISDLNKNKDEDGIDIDVYYGGKLIHSQRLDDDGIVGDSGRIKEDRDVEVRLDNLPEGAYKVELKAGDDVITKKIETMNSKMSFINKIWLADNDRNGLRMYTDSKFIAAQTINPGRLQKIKIGNNELELKNTFGQERIETDHGLKEINLEKDDVILAGDGIFAFDRGSFFNPLIKKVNNSMEADKDGVDYILADYRSPEARHGAKVAIIDFDLSNAYRENGRYGFLISIPGLRVEDGLEDGLIIKDIEISLEGNSIIEFLKKKLDRHE